jgi:hypothetical protein
MAPRVAEVHGGTITIGPAEVVGGQDRGCRVMLALPASDPGGIAAVAARSRATAMTRHGEGW